MTSKKSCRAGSIYEDYESPLTSEVMPKEIVDVQTVELCKLVNHYLMEKFPYRKEPASLGISRNTIYVYRASIELYLRFKPRYLKPIDPNALVIARMGFRRQREGYGTDLLRFLVRHAVDFGIDTIVIESPHSESIQAFGKKFEFKRINEDFLVTSTVALLKKLDQYPSSPAP